MKMGFSHQPLQLPDRMSASDRSESDIMKLNERQLTVGADVPRFRGNFPRNYFRFRE